MLILVDSNPKLKELVVVECNLDAPQFKIMMEKATNLESVNLQVTRYLK